MPSNYTDASKSPSGDELAATAARIAYLRARPALFTAEVAELTGVSVSQIRRAMRSGELPTRYVGKRPMVATVDALAYVGATAEAAA